MNRDSGSSVDCGGGGAKEEVGVLLGRWDEGAEGGLVWRGEGALAVAVVVLVVGTEKGGGMGLLVAGLLGRAGGGGIAFWAVNEAGS